jgi:hypothetical protein
MGVFQVFSNKSPGFQTGPAPGAYIQVSDLRAIMALLFLQLSIFVIYNLSDFIFVLR